MVSETFKDQCALVCFFAKMINEQETNNQWWQSALMIFIRLSAWVGVPILAAVWLGKWLDKKFASEPLIFLTAVGLAFLISTFGLIKEAVAEFKKAEKPSGDQLEGRSEQEKK